MQICHPGIWCKFIIFRGTRNISPFNESVGGFLFLSPKLDSGGGCLIGSGANFSIESLLLLSLGK